MAADGKPYTSLIYGNGEGWQANEDGDMGGVQFMRPQTRSDLTNVDLGKNILVTDDDVFRCVKRSSIECLSILCLYQTQLLSCVLPREIYRIRFKENQFYDEVIMFRVKSMYSSRRNGRF